MLSLWEKLLIDILNMIPQDGFTDGKNSSVEVDSELGSGGLQVKWNTARQADGIQVVVSEDGT